MRQMKNIYQDGRSILSLNGNGLRIVILNQRVLSKFYKRTNYILSETKTLSISKLTD